MSVKTVFMTGTDTDVGKTFCGCVLLQCLKAMGHDCAAFKPVASGVEAFSDGLKNPDTEALFQYSNQKHTREQITPYFFEEAIAPHLAAAKHGRKITLADIDTHFQNHFDPNQLTLVEGAGGWEVPLNENESFADLALQFAGPIILVVDIKLGCINHALLTAHRIRNQGGNLVAWLANNRRQYELARENIDAINARIDLPLLGELPDLKSPDEGTRFIDERLLSTLLL